MITQQFKSSDTNTYKTAIQNINQQVISIIDALDNPLFQKTGKDQSSIGQHIRHIINFFESVNQGIEQNSINYDNRHRSVDIENNTNLAKQAMNNQTILLLQKIDEQDLSNTVEVKENSHTAESTIARELISLQSHTIHHLAIIKPLIKSMNIVISESIGISASTIIYKNRNS